MVDIGTHNHVGLSTHVSGHGQGPSNAAVGATKLHVHLSEKEWRHDFNGEPCKTRGKSCWTKDLLNTLP
jgi:hypothetical protein